MLYLALLRSPSALPGKQTDTRMLATLLLLLLATAAPCLPHPAAKSETKDCSTPYVWQESDSLSNILHTHNLSLAAFSQLNPSVAMPVVPGHTVCLCRGKPHSRPFTSSYRPGKRAASASPSGPPAKRAKRPRCGHAACKKRLGHIRLTCRCGGVYCLSHHQDHECSFDYKAQAQEEIRDKNPVVVDSKVDKL
ncbi:MAG: hypothetical protein SGCHY_005082 [Lobulomycetales sp.]